MENVILKKLGLTKRGALNILKDKDLCHRIINEDITEIKEAVDIYNVSYTRLFKLIKDGKLSYISNSMLRNGCKKYIFNAELEYLINENVSSQTSVLHAVNQMYDTIDSLAKTILKDKEYLIFSKHNKGQSLESISYEIDTSDSYAALIYSRSIKKLKTYFTKLKKYNELSELNNQLSNENERLKKANLLLKNKVINNEYKYIIEDWRYLNINKLDISPRLKKVFNQSDIARVEDLINVIKSNGLSYFKKFRNVGYNTFNELSFLVNKLALENNTSDVEFIKSLKE